MPARRLTLLAALAFAVLAVRPALAHGPTRQKIELSVDLKAPAAQVWAVVGNFQDLSWNPDVASVKGTGGNTAGGTALRTITLKSGAVLPAEELDEYDATKMTYATFLPHVDPKQFPVADFSSHVTVIPKGTGSTLDIRAAFYRGYPNNDPPADMNEAAAIKAVTAYFQPGLDAMKAKFGAGS